jgi:hypothetical protein
MGTLHRQLVDRAFLDTNRLTFSLSVGDRAQGRHTDENEKNHLQPKIPHETPHAKNPIIILMRGMTICLACERLFYWESMTRVPAVLLYPKTLLAILPCTGVG